MKWFKHYCESHDGQTFSELWAENDTETIAFYWVILEMVGRWEDWKTPENRGIWTGNLSIFKRKLGMKSQRSRRLLTKISLRFQVNLEWISDQSFQLSVPNWLKLQETRGKEKRKKSGRNAVEVRSQKLEVSNTCTFEPIGVGAHFVKEIYESYPRELGKARGLSMVKKIKTKEDCDRLRLAVANYNKYISREKIEIKFVMYFSTFMNQWEDWTDPETGAESLSSKKESLDSWKSFGEDTP